MSTQPEPKPQPPILRPAEKVAYLTALIDAAKVELELAKNECLQVAEEVGVDRFTTMHGPVLVATPKVQITILSEPDFLAWVKANHPTEVIEQVRKAFRDVVIDRLTVTDDGGDVIDRETGEVVPWAGTVEAGRPYIAYPATTEQKALKEEAREWFHERAAATLGGMRMLRAVPR